MYARGSLLSRDRIFTNFLLTHEDLINPIYYPFMCMGIMDYWRKFGEYLSKSYGVRVYRWLENPLIIRRRIITERGGFEPPMEFNPHNSLAGSRFQPLSHLSKVTVLYHSRLILFVNIKINLTRGNNSN